MGFYGECIKEALLNDEINDFKRMNVDQHILMLDGINGTANDDLCRRYHRKSRQRIKRWTLELSRKRRLVRQLRERFQKAREVSAENTEEIRILFRRN